MLRCTSLITQRSTKRYFKISQKSKRHEKKKKKKKKKKKNTTATTIKILQHILFFLKII